MKYPRLRSRLRFNNLITCRLEATPLKIGVSQYRIDHLGDHLSISKEPTEFLETYAGLTSAHATVAGELVKLYRESYLTNASD